MPQDFVDPTPEEQQIVVLIEADDLRTEKMIIC
jgi:hypothetical protein